MERLLTNLNTRASNHDLIPLTYNMLVNNIDISKQKNVKSGYSFLNLQRLVEEFRLDSNFISKSYYQSDPEFAYNNPPKGPIDKYFECMFCGNSGPGNHDINCRRPFTSSLFLTGAGSRSTEYEKYEEGTPYNMAVVKRGQKKVISTSVKTDKFQDSVELTYSDVNGKECIIRIAKNGSVNIISAGFGNERLPGLVIKKINETGALNLGEYQKEYPGKRQLDINPLLTYKYLLLGQFNLYPKEHQEVFYVNLGALNEGIRARISGRMLDEEYYINKYKVNLGDVLSRSNKMTNPYISFNLTPGGNPNFKMSVTIYKRGAVQMRVSYTDSKEVSKSQNVLDYQLLESLFEYLSELFNDIIINSEKPVIVSESIKIKKGIQNMRDGKQPQMCHDRQGLRPVPYSFYGQCPDDGYYVRPVGVKRPDGLYEPCCKKIKKTGKDSDKRINDIILNGYPDAQDSSEVPDPDTLSAVFSPGTKNIESRRFRGLKQLSVPELKSCIRDTGYVKEADLFDESRALDEYPEFVESIFKEYSDLTGTRKLLGRRVNSLTINSFKKFTESPYLVTPINEGTIRVILFFNYAGESFFINENNDISQSSLNAINNLKNTVIEGYLYPQPDEFVFYPIDIYYYSGKNVSNLDYVRSRGESRFELLNLSVEVINTSGNGSLVIVMELRFDLDLVNGSRNYLVSGSFGEISGLLFIPIQESQILLHWISTQVDSNYSIALNVNKVKGNRWSVGIDSRDIPIDQLPQESGTIEIGVSFENKNSLKNGDLVLFKINILKNGNINPKTPLIPISKIDEKINDYQTVINVLNSINRPILKSTFINIQSESLPNGFTVSTRNYHQYTDARGNPDLNRPLVMVNIGSS